VPFGRPLFDEGGSFQGIVVAALIPSAMRGLFQTMDVGRRGAVWVFHPDGIVLLRVPSDNDPQGQSATTNAIFEAAKRAGAPGTTESRVRPGEPMLLTAFRPTTEPPIIVAVSLDRTEVLHDWRRQIVESAVFFVVLGTMMIGTLLVLFRQMEQTHEAER